MKTNEYAFIAFLIIVGLFFGYFIIGSVASHIVGIFKQNESGTYVFNNESLTNLNPEGDYEYRANVTRKIAADLSERFLEENILPSIEKASGTETTLNSLLGKIDFENINENDIQNISQDIQLRDFGIIGSYDASKLKIVMDTPQSIKNYWDQYGNISSEVFNKIESADINKELDNVLNGEISENLKELISGFKNVSEKLKLIEVPQSLVDFHIKNIVFFTNEYSVLNSVVNFKSDPLKAYVMVEYSQYISEDLDYILDCVKKYAPKSNQ